MKPNVARSYTVNAQNCLTGILAGMVIEYTLPAWRFAPALSAMAIMYWVAGASESFLGTYVHHARVGIGVGMIWRESGGLERDTDDTKTQGQYNVKSVHC